MATVLETDETGALVLPARVLGHDAAHVRYVLEARGEALILRQREAPTAKPKKPRKKALTPDQWKAEWEAWSEKVTETWQSDKSATEIVVEMRR